MKELTELENAISKYWRSAGNGGTASGNHLARLAERLITRLKECDLGKQEIYKDSVVSESTRIEYVHGARICLSDKELIGKSGKLYFVPEESET